MGIVVTGHKKQQGYNQLVPFAATLGIHDPCASITMQVDGVEHEISLDIDSGRVRGLDMLAKSKGLPDVNFRREKSEDVEAKQRGIARELQTGDPTFDAAVYIESDASDGDLLMVLQPQVRAAILELLSSFETVQFLAGEVCATRNFSIPAAFEPALIQHQISLLRVVAGAPRPQKLAPPKSNALFFGFLSSIPISIAAFSVLTSRYRLESSIPMFAGMAAGLLVALALWVPIGRALANRSTSHKDIPIVRFMAIISMPLLIPSSFYFVDAVLDGSPAKEHTYSVDRVVYDNEESQSDVEAGSGSYVFKDRDHLVKRGQKLRVKLHPGLLGVAWQEGKATVDVGERVLSQQ